MTSFKLHTLDNGARVLLVPISGVKSVAVGVFVGTGSRYEDAKSNGISHFIEHMAFKGTQKYPTTRDTSRLEGLGAVQNAWTDVDATCYYCKIPSDKWLEALDLVKDLALYPTFPLKDLEIERGVIIEEIRMYKDKPEYLVGRLFQKMLYGPTGLGQEIVGNEEVIKSLTRDQFLDYHHSHYISANTVICLAGQLSDQAFARSEGFLQGVPTSRPLKYTSPKPQQKSARLELEENYKIKQVHLALGGYGLTSADPRRFVASILFSILGQGMSSRLFLELREKQGVCYSVHASDERYPDIGHWEIYAGLNTDKLQAAVSGIVTQLRVIKEKPVTSAELIQAQEKLRGAILFAQENPIRQMEFYAHQVLDRPTEVLDYDTIVGRLMQISIRDVQELARDLFQSFRLNLAVVGPIDPQIKGELVKLLEI